MRVLKNAFPRSVTMQYANFMPGELLPNDDHSFLRSVFELGQDIGVAIGAPDLMPEKPNQREHALRFLREFKGKIVSGIAVQDGNYIGETGNNTNDRPYKNIVPELAKFAQNNLEVSCMFWVAQEPYFSNDVVTFLKRGNVISSSTLRPHSCGSSLGEQTSTVRSKVSQP